MSRAEAGAQRITPPIADLQPQEPHRSTRPNSRRRGARTTAVVSLALLATPAVAGCSKFPWQETLTPPTVTRTETMPVAPASPSAQASPTETQAPEKTYSQYFDENEQVLKSAGVEDPQKLKILSLEAFNGGNPTSINALLTSRFDVNVSGTKDKEEGVKKLIGTKKFVTITIPSGAEHYLPDGVLVFKDKPNGKPGEYNVLMSLGRNEKNGNKASVANGEGIHPAQDIVNDPKTYTIVSPKDEGKKKAPASARPQQRSAAPATPAPEAPPTLSETDKLPIKERRWLNLLPGEKIELSEEEKQRQRDQLRDLPLGEEQRLREEAKRNGVGQ